MFTDINIAELEASFKGAILKISNGHIDDTSVYRVTQGAYIIPQTSRLVHFGVYNSLAHLKHNLKYSLLPSNEKRYYVVLQRLQRTHKWHFSVYNRC